MAKTVNDLILGALNNLSADQLDRFKRTPSAGIGYGLIEKESNMALTNMIIEKFTTKNAIAHTAKVLRELNLNNQATELEEAYAHVACDVCTGRKRKAVKSCLVCVASSCETHLQPHYESPALKKRKLTPATGHLQEKICSHHGKPLECAMDEHKGHDTVSAAEERTEKKGLRRKKRKHLGLKECESQQIIQESKKELQDLRQVSDSLTRSAQAAVEDSERIFTELIRSFKRKRSEVKELIRDQEKAAVSRAERTIEQLKD
ncbi:hypothetical protein AAFF_G00030140, partial [Aldrovandia affinis]